VGKGKRDGGPLMQKILSLSSGKGSLEILLYLRNHLSDGTLQNEHSFDIPFPLLST
jgi:hypothetical protein